MPHRLFFCLAFLLLPFCDPAPAPAWSRDGHEVICAITEDLLGEQTRREVARLLAPLASVEPAAHDLPAACAWLDDVRRTGLGHFDHWHYVNLPINPQGLPLPTRPADDVIFAIRQSVATLRDEAASEFARAFALRVLLHTVGDIHQPLHTASRLSARHPEGDRGGNDFPLAADGRVDNLHLLWDQGVGLFARVGAERRPETLRRLVHELEVAVAAETLPQSLGSDPAAWAEEGRRLAIEVVYPDIEEGGVPSREYRERAEPVIRRQLALAAHRLAALLDSALAPTRP